MSTINHTDVQPSQPIELSFTKIIPLFLRDINHKKTYDKNIIISFKAIFYREFYIIRSENTLSSRNNVRIKWETFKELLHSIVLKFNHYYSDDPDFKNISHQYALTIFSKLLPIQKLKNDQIIYFTNMNVEIGDKKKTFLLNKYKNLFPDINNKVMGLAIFTLLKFGFFSKKGSVPFEIFAIIMYDAFHYYKKNKDFFSGGNAIFQRFIMEECITLRVMQAGRKVFLDEDPNSREYTYHLLRQPPFMHDTRMQLDSVNIVYTRSLPLLCHYFGHDAWYDFFIVDYLREGINKQDLYKFQI